MINYRDIANQSIASQDKFELTQLLELLDRLNPVRILEIGVHRGGVLETMSVVFPAAKLVGVDADFEPLEFHDFYQVKGNSNGVAVRDKAVKALDYMIDFLFIDGGHEYEVVKRDYELYSQYVRPGGIIAFHDIMRPQGMIEGVEVRRFWDELRFGGKRGGCYTMEIWGGGVRTDGPHPSDAPGIGVLFV